MEKAEKWTKFADLWVRAGLSHLVRASQNVMCTHRAAEPHRHTACVHVCVRAPSLAPLLTQTQDFPSLLNRRDDPARRNLALVCLCLRTCCRSLGNNVFQVQITADRLCFTDVFLWCLVSVARNSKLGFRCGMRYSMLRSSCLAQFCANMISLNLAFQACMLQTQEEFAQ